MQHSYISHLSVVVSLRLNVQTEYCEIATIVLFTAINLKFKSVNNTKKNKTKTVIMLFFILFNT